MGDTSIFSKRLKESRKQAELSQKKLGELAGLDPFVAGTRVNRYERGVHSPPDFEIIKKMAAALEVPPPYLFTCQVPCGYLPRKSYPYFRARSIFNELANGSTAHGI